MRKLLFVILTFILGIVILNSCKNNESITSDPSAKLQFSTDTVFFDTIFTQLSSVTLHFKVYNRGDRAVNVSEIKLAGESPFIALM